MFKSNKLFTEPCSYFESQFWRKSKCKNCFYPIEAHNVLTNSSNYKISKNSISKKEKPKQYSNHIKKKSDYSEKSTPIEIPTMQPRIVVESPSNPSSNSNTPEKSKGFLSTVGNLLSINNQKSQRLLNRSPSNKKSSKKKKYRVEGSDVTYTYDEIMHSTYVNTPDSTMEEIPIFPKIKPLKPFSSKLLHKKSRGNS